MKKYTKPSIEVVELSVKESLSALPTGFGSRIVKSVTANTLGSKTVTIYKKGSGVSAL